DVGDVARHRDRRAGRSRSPRSRRRTRRSSGNVAVPGGLRRGDRARTARRATGGALREVHGDRRRKAEAPQAAAVRSPGTASEGPL
ncbi:MAG: hypothetical protein AVDCRST_MAG66-199, partial [uncultured Pseudonocardia sp.]